MQLREYLRAYIAEHKVPPTQAQMAQALNTRPGAIVWLLMKLEQYGQIERGRGWRSVRLLDTA